MTSDQAMSLNRAQACFSGPQKLIAVCDYDLLDLKFSGDLQTTNYTDVLSNHPPSHLDGERITYYGKNANLRESYGEFLAFQTNRLRRLQEAPDSETHWGRVSLGDFRTLVTRAHLAKWLNTPIDQQNRLCVAASRAGNVTSMGNHQTSRARESVLDQSLATPARPPALKGPILRHSALLVRVDWLCGLHWSRGLTEKLLFHSTSNQCYRPTRDGQCCQKPGTARSKRCPTGVDDGEKPHRWPQRGTGC
jgi:hypothetical protein